MACRGDLSLSVAQLPDGKDPEDCINSGLDLFNIIESAKPWLDWQLDVWLKSVDRSDTARYTEIEARIRALVESIHSPTLRQYYIDKASLALSQDPESAAKTAKDWFKNTSTINSRKRWLKPSPLETRIMAERRLLRLYIHFPELRSDLVDLMDRLYSPAHKWLWQRLREIEDFCDGANMIWLCTACRNRITRDNSDQ
jgi:DNA primase